MTGIIITSIICGTVLIIAIIQDVRKQQEKKAFEETLKKSAETLQRNLTALTDKKQRKEKSALTSI